VIYLLFAWALGWEAGVHRHMRRGDSEREGACMQFLKKVISLV
jgi:hypothetical protein